MKVFIVMNGEQHEGGAIISVHKTVESATKAALAARTCFDGGWVLAHPLYWVNGCDFVEVVEKQVEE